jgi:DNA-binding CsgD family transcriptional regulator
VLQLTDTLLGVSGGNRTTPSNASIALARRAVDIAKRIGVVNGIDSVRSTLDRSPRSHFARSGESALTRREREVLSLISKGRSNRQIADELFVNPNTVDTHVRNIFLKLGVNSRAEAAQKSARMNLD